jgi:hypothetical protein
LLLRFENKPKINRTCFSGPKIIGKNNENKTEKKNENKAKIKQEKKNLTFVHFLILPNLIQKRKNRQESKTKTKKHRRRKTKKRKQIEKRKKIQFFATISGFCHS